MSTFRITGVRTTPNGWHDHITDVGVDGGYTWSVQTVLNDLRRSDGDRYYTEAGGYRAEVIARPCPHCGTHDYITTTPDSTTENNLLSLPRI